MHNLSQYLSKRYFKLFLLFFVPWYYGSFILGAAYSAIDKQFLFVANNLFYPMILAGFGYLYFRKSKNDWDDRFAVIVGWIGMTIILSALLAQPMYGFSWTTILNSREIMTHWVGVVALLVAAFVAKRA